MMHRVGSIRAELVGARWWGGEVDGVGQAHNHLLQDRALMRDWDLVRAAKAEKVGFWADTEAYFLIFRDGGGARAGPLRVCRQGAKGPRSGEGAKPRMADGGRFFSY